MLLNIKYEVLLSNGVEKLCHRNYSFRKGKDTIIVRFTHKLTIPIILSRYTVNIRQLVDNRQFIIPLIEFQYMQSVFFYALIPFVTFILGGIVAKIQQPSNTWRSIIQHFTSGVVFAIVAVDLLPSIIYVNDI